MSEPRRHHESLGRVNKRLAELWEAAGSQPIIHKPPSIPLLLLLLDPYDWVGVWCFLVARRGPTNSTKANAQDYKVHLNRILCVDSLRCLFSLSHLLFTSPHMRRPVLQTKIGRQEYRKDSFCLGVGRWGGIRTQKKNQLEEKEGKKTNTHTHKKKVTMHGWSFYKCGGGGDFTELWFPTRPTRHIRTFGISHQTAQISNRYIHSAAQLCIIGFPSQAKHGQRKDFSPTAHH